MEDLTKTADDLFDELDTMHNQATESVNQGMQKTVSLTDEEKLQKALEMSMQPNE